MANPAEVPRPRNTVSRLRPVQRLRMPRNLQADRVWAFARTLERGVRNPAFRELVQKIDGSPWHALDQVNVYHDGEETFAAMVGEQHTNSSHLAPEVTVAGCR